MPKNRRLLPLLLATALCAAWNAAAAESAPQPAVGPGEAQAAAPSPLERGLDLFREARYREALDDFGRVLADPRAGADRPEAAYWTVIAYIASGDPASAEKSLDAFMAAYPGHPRGSELIYQRGRIQFGKGDYEGALISFAGYAAARPTGDLLPAALFWSGESLYALGRLEEAEKAFAAVVERYPDSVKYEAATFRRALIGLEFRERELLKLLSWSHEESLRIVEDFRRRERAYEQALAVYQKQVADARRGAPTEPDKELAALRASSSELAARVAALETDLAAARDALARAVAARDEALRAAGQAALAPTPTLPAPPAAAPAAVPGGTPSTVAEALAAKARALELLSFYIEKIASGEGK